MNKDRVLRFLIASVFSVIAAVNGVRYAFYSYHINNEAPISYTVLDMEAIGGGRSTRYYSISVKYENYMARVDVPGNVYKDAVAGKLPDLYLTRKYGQVYGQWDATSAFKWSLFTGLAALLCWVPVWEIGKRWKVRTKVYRHSKPGRRKNNQK